MRILEFYFVLIEYQNEMTQCNTLNVKLSNSQLNRLKSGEQNGTEVFFKSFIRYDVLILIMIRLIFNINCY